MNQDFIIDMANQSLKTTALLAAPMLLGALVVGLIVSVFQAVTQINEQTLSFIPKIVVIGASMVIFGPWMIDILSGFTRELFINIPQIISGK